MVHLIVLLLLKFVTLVPTFVSDYTVSKVSVSVNQISISLALVPDKKTLNMPAEENDISGYICGTCDATVTSFHHGVVCEGCGQWFHAHCQSIDDSSYNHLGDPDVIWRCLICDCAHYSTTAFDLQEVHNSSFLSFGDSVIQSPGLSAAPKPLHASTPTRLNHQHHFDRSQNRPLRLVNVNTRSNIKNLPGFLNLVETTKPDIIIATETRLDTDIRDSEFLPPNFKKAYRCDRNRQGGGCFVAVANHLTHCEISELSVDGCELSFTRIKLPGKKDLIVGAYYKPDDGDELSLDLFTKALQRLRSTNAYVIIGGDFNFPALDWSTGGSLKTHNCYPRLHTKFIDIINDHGLQQMVTFPTRDNNTLDLFLTNHPSLVPRVEGVPGISDHLAVYMEFNIQHDSWRNFDRLVPCYKKADWTKAKSMAAELSNQITKSFTNESNTEEIWDTFKVGVHKISKDTIPLIQLKPKQSKPWVDANTKRLLRRRDRAYKR